MPDPNQSLRKERCRIGAGRIDLDKARKLSERADKPNNE